MALMRRNDIFCQLIKRELQSRGIETYHFEEDRKKRSVVVEHAGVTVRVRFPKSSANFNGPKVTRMRLRHALDGHYGGAR